MNFKQKLGYMFIGCLFTIAGYILASLGGMTTHAQKDEQVIDKIVCKRLEVVNEEGTTAALIVVDARGDGAIEVRNKAGKVVASIVVDARDGGAISVFNPSGEVVANMTVGYKFGGDISVYTPKGKLAARHFGN